MTLVYICILYGLIDRRSLKNGPTNQVRQRGILGGLSTTTTTTINQQQHRTVMSIWGGLNVLEKNIVLALNISLTTNESPQVTSRPAALRNPPIAQPTPLPTR